MHVEDRLAGRFAVVEDQPELAAGALDLALVFNEGPDHTAAGVFTRNKIKAAPVLWSTQVLTTGRLRAVILNSGGANACTGPAGFQDTHATAEAVAAALSDWGTETGAIEVAVCSTGLIGDRLPMDKVRAGVTSTCAIMSYHSLRCWGSNQNGALGVGHFTPQQGPVPVSW